MGPMALLLHTLHAQHWFAALAALSALVLMGQLAVPGAPGDGAGGADADAGDAGDGGDAGDVAEGDAGAGDGDGRQAADPDDEDAEIDTLPDSNVRTRLRRMQRQHRTVAPIADVFRDQATGRYLSPQEAAQERQQAADMREIRAFYDEHPDLLQQMLERRRKGGQPAAAATDDFQDPYADATKLPWDTESESGRFFTDYFRKNERDKHDLQQTVKRLEQALSGVNERDTQRTFSQIETSWKTETLAAAKTAGLTGDDLEDFVNGVYANFRLAKAEQRLGKVNRQQIIDRALRPFKRNRVAGDRRAAAGAHARAAGNTNRPRPGSRDGAGPANPKDTNHVGTIRDSRKSFFERVGQSAPPGGRS